MLGAGPSSIDAIVTRVYAGLQADLIDAAAENVHAHLIKLLEEGRATKADGDASASVKAAIWSAV